MTVTDEYLQGALDELLDETGALTRVLLGASPGAGADPRDLEAGGSPGAHPASMAMGADPPGISGRGVGGSRGVAQGFS